MMPLASTKTGRLLLAPLSNAGSVAKYSTHSRPALSILRSLEKSASPRSSPALLTPALSLRRDRAVLDLEVHGGVEGLSVGFAEEFLRREGGDYETP
jgi:hypothetical protein